MHPLPPLTVLLDVVADVTGGSTVTRRALHPTYRIHSSCQLRPPIKVAGPPRVETGSSMPPSADSCGQGSTLGERGTTVFHVKPPATGRLLDALVPTSLQATEPHGPPHPARSRRGLPEGLHRSHHSHTVPVPSRQTSQETEQGSSAPQRHLRPHTLDVPCPQMLSTYQHRRSLVTTSRRVLASATTCLCIHWGHTTALPHSRISFSAHRNAQQNCPSGAANRPLQLRRITADPLAADVPSRTR